MSLNNLRPPKGAKHSKMRVGRGHGSGQGKTVNLDQHRTVRRRLRSDRHVQPSGGRMPQSSAAARRENEKP